MPESDRPAGTAPSLRALRGGGRSRRLPKLTSPAEIARRLAALEAQVEAAFASANVTPVSAGPIVRTTLDEGLSVVANAQRWIGDAWSGFAPGGPVVHTMLEALFHYWWRVETIGFERIPERGPVVVAINRAGSWLPIDAVMVALAIGDRQGSTRRPRLLLDPWLLRLPLVGGILGDLGAHPATPSNLRRVLDAGDVAVVYPEGPDAVFKPYAKAYRVGPLARVPLLKESIVAQAHVVPVGVIGAEDVAPVLARVPLPGSPFGVPAIPITATFPMLGALGLVPLPSKWTLLAGDPIDVASSYRPETVRDGAAMRRFRDQLRERLQGIVSEGVRRRRSVFFG